MMRQTSLILSSIFCCLLVIDAGAQSGQRVRRGGGPPPEMRALIEAVVTAFNSGRADEWEAMAMQRFAPGHLARRSATERAEMYERLRADFGTIDADKVLREGPDAPLELYVRGSTGAEGVISLEIEPSAPFRVTGMQVRLGGDGGERSSVAAPPINGIMTAEELTAALDAYLSRMAADDTFSGVVLVANDGQPVFEKAYGFADRSTRIPNTMATRFNLGSINKAFTQIAIAQLVAQGKLAREATLGKIVPDYPQEASRSATIEQLLAHEAGLADFFGPEFDRMSKDRLRSNADYFRFVSSLPPRFAPGERRQYCTGCFIALGEIIERVSGVPYERYIAENVFKPAGMATAGFFHRDGIEPNVARSYTRRADEGRLRDAVFMHGASGSAAGGAFATAADLLAFRHAVKSGTLPRGHDRRGDREVLAGGAPGLNAVLAAEGLWTAIVLTNLDPTAGEDVGIGIARALSD